MSHVIPLQLVQKLKSLRWNCNVFERSQKMTVGNYVRNLSGPGPAPGHCSQAPRLKARPCPPVPPLPPAPSSPSGGFTPVVPGVLLCWLARSLPCVRYKILPARCCANQCGTKLSLHAEKAPNWAISGERGEFCTAHAVRRGVQGEFCTAHAARAGVPGELCTEGARCGCSWASCVVLLRSTCASWRAMAAAWRCSRASWPRSPGPPVPSTPVGPDC